MPAKAFSEGSYKSDLMSELRSKCKGRQIETGSGEEEVIRRFV